MPTHPISDIPRRRPRTGCFGCLWQIGVVLTLGVVLSIALIGVFYPWAFYLGGKFHIIPIWHGWGRAHAKSGDYLVWVQFEPTSKGSGMHLTSNLTGDAWLCTPRGERMHMHLGGSMRKHLNLSTDGEAITLYMNYWPLGYGGFISDRRPYLEFRGNWRNPNIVMDDQGSIGRSFQPDGTVYRGHGGGPAYQQQAVPITFAAGPRSDFDQACKTLGSGH